MMEAERLDALEQEEAVLGRISAKVTRVEVRVTSDDGLFTLTGEAYLPMPSSTMKRRGWHVSVPSHLAAVLLDAEPPRGGDQFPLMVPMPDDATQEQAVEMAAACLTAEIRLRKAYAEALKARRATVQEVVDVRTLRDGLSTSGATGA